MHSRLPHAANAPPSIHSVPAPTSTDSSEEQPRNASMPTARTLSGMDTAVKASHPAKAPSSMYATPSGMVTPANPPHPSNANGPMPSTPPGIA